MYLFINTASAEFIQLALTDGQGQILVKKNIKAKYKQSEKLLPGVENLLKAYGNTPLRKLQGIVVVKGPGSFTALRIGLTVANTMAFGLNIPVVGVMDGEFEKIIGEGMKKLKGSIEAPHPLKILAGQGRLDQQHGRLSQRSSYVMPEYGMEPNITIKNTIKQ